MDVVAALTKVVQEQQRRIDELEARFEEELAVDLEEVAVSQK